MDRSHSAFVSADQASRSRRPIPPGTAPRRSLSLAASPSPRSRRQRSQPPIVLEAVADRNHSSPSRLALQALSSENQPSSELSFLFFGRIDPGALRKSGNS